jgi:phosphoribosylaminoimidazolecarboxamide formyltransferase/IMP cyclohydrolase
MKAEGITRSTKFMLAKKVFAHTAAYDGMITNYLTSLEAGCGAEATEAVPAKEAYPAVYNLQLHKVQGMRYGENPHQSAAFYREAAPVAGTLAQWTQIQGKELSFNNIADADAAWECVKAFEECACVIVKHANPCGVAVGATPLEAYQKALKTDPTSAFGGIMAFNRPIDADVVEAINANKQFVEVAIAPAITPAARAAYASKQNVRLLEVPISKLSNALDFKRVGGGMLLQSATTSTWSATSRWCPRCNPPQQQLQGHAVCLDRGPLRQEQRHRVLQGRHDHGRGRRPDEPPGLGPHCLDQGWPRRFDPAGHRGGVGRLLPVP